MLKRQKCITCEGLKKKLEEAKAKNDLELAQIAHCQMREHLSRVKYPNKHGFNK
jgi:hypothetical protein